MGLAAALAFVCSFACATEHPVEVTVHPALACPQCPDPVVVETFECKRAIKLNGIRNRRIHKRMDECEQAGNGYVQCSHWVFGEYEED